MRESARLDRLALGLALVQLLGWSVVGWRWVG